MDALRDRIRRRPHLAVLGGAVLIAIVAWAVLWTTVQPRAEWDGLIYHRLAFQYAGLTEEEQIASSFTIFRRYADPALQRSVERGIAGGGSVWELFDDPERARWHGIYASRPLYPVVAAALHPLLDLRAPLAASALAVLIFSIAMLAGLGPLSGYGVAAIAFVLSLANEWLGRWLISLQTDGLSLALWAAALVLVARLVTSRSWGWLAALFGVSLALVLARPLGMFLPVVAGLCTVIAFPFDRRVAWRFGAATVVTGVSALIYLGYAQLVGLPSFSDVLQDLPTAHYVRPDVPDPLAATWDTIVTQVPDHLLPTLFADPRLWGSVGLGMLGLIFVGRSWWVAPFAVAPIAIVLSYMAHPAISEVPRNMSGVWISVYIGMAMLVVAGLRYARVLDRMVRTPISPR